MILVQNLDQEVDDVVPTKKKTPGFWSLVTSDESVKRGQINFWAIAETLLAIVAFWYVALHWETFFLLYSSLFIAPLLLLRSETSTKHGAKLLENGFFPPKLPERPLGLKTERKPLVYSWAWIGLAVALGVLFAIGYPAAKSIFSGQLGWAGIWRGAAFVYVLTIVAAALAVALAEAVALTAALVVSGMGAALIVLFEGGTGAPVGALLAALAAALTGLVTLTIANALAYNGAVARAGTLPAAAMQIGSGFFHIMMYGVVRSAGFGWVPIAAAALYFVPILLLSVLLASVFFRSYASILHFFDCYAAMPLNLRRLSFFTAPGHAPELLPGLPSGHHLRFGSMATKGKDHLAERGFSGKFLGVAYILMIPIWFIIGWGYRVVLKSTLWLWWVLFFIGGAPNVADGIAGVRADTYRKMSSWILIAVAVFTLVAFFFGKALKPLIVNHLNDASLIGPVALIALIDWKAISIFQWVLLLSSTLTISVVVWTHNLVVDESEVPGRKNKVEKQLRRLGYLLNWKTGIGMLSIALLMAYVAFYANATHHWLPISKWVFEWLTWLYGDNAKALLLPS